MKGKVALEGLEFHAYHGVYPHERSSGNKFEVDIEVETEFPGSRLSRRPPVAPLTSEDLYRLVKKMKWTSLPKLLETVGHAIAEKILQVIQQRHQCGSENFQVQSSNWWRLQESECRCSTTQINTLIKSGRFAIFLC